MSGFEVDIIVLNKRDLIINSFNHIILIKKFYNCYN